MITLCTLKAARLTLCGAVLGGMAVVAMRKCRRSGLMKRRGNGDTAHEAPAAS